MPDRVLILANEFIVDADRSLPTDVRERADRPHDVLVVAPLLTTRLQSYASDVDGARADAERRLTRIAADIERRGTAPRTVVGDENQLVAVEDALAWFDADVCVVVSHARGCANYHERKVAQRIRDTFALPTINLVVDEEGRLTGSEAI